MQMAVNATSGLKDFNVFAVAENGILKCINVCSKGNILKNFNQDSSPLEREHEITCLNWLHDNEEDLIIGQRNQTVKIFSLDAKSFTKTLEVKAGEGPLRGVAAVDDTIVTACESGIVSLWRDDSSKILTFDTIDTEISSSGKLKSGEFASDEARIKHQAAMKEGRLLCKMRQNPVVKNQISTGGKENQLQIWDLNRAEEGPIFLAKNVKADSLQLRVPVWISDICYPDPNTPSNICAVSRFGHIRLYDIRSGQRRPVQDLLWENEALTSVSATPHNEQILVASGTGNLALYDFRARHRGLFRKYKGCVGSVRSIYSLRDKPYFAVVGLDRFLRIYNLSEQKSVQKMYLKSRLNGVLLSKDFDPSNLKEEKEDRKSKPAVADVRPEVEVVEDEKFWAKIPIIREKKREKSKEVVGKKRVKLGV